ncbi:MAG: YsnF/AvaK domain-containing protein [Pyrinomonadaceae bacterium]
MTKTVVGMFDSSSQAERAAQELVSAGFSRDQIDLVSQEAEQTNASDEQASLSASRTSAGVGDRISRFFGNLFGSDYETSENKTYYNGVRSGGTVLAVEASSDALANHALEILDRNDAVDVDERAVQHQQASGQVNDRTQNQTGEAAIPVIQEELQVGKRAVERGVRVRSRVIERPVEAQVNLREEHVHVERRPVDQAVTDADVQSFREGTIEVTETAEVAVVSKQARVVEEVVVGKDVQERTETVRDTVKSTDVDVEEINSDTRTRSQRSSS